MKQQDDRACQEANGIYLYDKRFQIPFIPCPVKLDLPFTVKAIACGAHHSLLLADNGQIFGCGLANDGQLGLVEADYEWITQRLKALAERHSQGRIVSCLEGGYSLSALARSVAAHLRVLAEM